MISNWSRVNTISDIRNEGINYLHSLICDYQQYIYDFGFIQLLDFVQGWECISLKNFINLEENDIVYDAVGNKYVVYDVPFESDDETCYYVEVSQEDDKTNTQIFSSGDLYLSNKFHSDYNWKQRKRKGEEILCPILITKTNPHQS